MAYAKKLPESIESLKIPNKKFYTAKEGAAIYSIGVHAFERLAQEAGAKYKIGRRALYNVALVDEYMETFKEER